MGGIRASVAVRPPGLSAIGRDRNARNAIGRSTHLSVPILLVAALVTAATQLASAETNPYQRGPDPTLSLLDAASGPFRVTSLGLSDSQTPGFGAATIYRPTVTSAETFGGVAISPGFTATRSSIAWLARRVASHGFVVIAIDTNSLFDQPSSRATQLLSALDYLTRSSSVRSSVDPNRLAVMGHSMGGGGSLEATARRTSLRASVPLTPWNTDKTWPEVRTPTMIIGADGDTIAPVATHSELFYQSIPTTTEKAYLELRGATHFAPNSTNTTIGRYSVAWLKRWVDLDRRYDQFLCPAPAPSSTISEYRHTCPHG